MNYSYYPYRVNRQANNNRGFVFPFLLGTLTAPLFYGPRPYPAYYPPYPYYPPRPPFYY